MDFIIAQRRALFGNGWCLVCVDAAEEQLACAWSEVPR